MRENLLKLPNSVAVYDQLIFPIQWHLAWLGALTTLPNLGLLRPQLSYFKAILKFFDLNSVGPVLNQPYWV